MATTTTTKAINNSGVPNGGKLWTSAEEQRMMGLIDSGATLVLIARMLGRSPTAIESRAARFASRDFLRGCAVSPQPFFECAPVEMEKLLKKYPISKAALRRVLTTTPTEEILHLLGMTTGAHDTTPMPPVNLLCKLGILKPWTPPTDESKPAEEVSSESTTESSAVTEPVEEVSSESTTTETTESSSVDLIDEDKFCVLESNIKTEIEANVAQIQAFFLDYFKKPPVDEMLTRVSSLESTASDRFDTLEDKHSHVVTRLVALETTPEHIAAIEKKVDTVDAKLDKLLHFFHLDQ